MPIKTCLHAAYLALLVAACSPSADPKPVPTPALPGTQDEAPRETQPMTQTAPPEAATVTLAPADPKSKPIATPRPPEVTAAALVPTKTWPFVQWDNAKVAIFDLAPYSPRSHKRAFSKAKGMVVGTHLRPITAAQAQEAIGLLEPTFGEALVSKCPNPRHALVLYTGKQPVASINVCFECGDILIDPPYRQGASWPTKKEALNKAAMKGYEQAFPKWQAFFESDLGIPTDWRKLDVPDFAQ
ncbi:MAG: hypothetical protein ACI9MR_002748 [Myxococcota bacterium]|jgi:hypothetical protein